MELKEYRQKLDVIDREILSLFTERMKVVSQIGAYKKEQGLPVLDPGREQEKLDSIASQSTEELTAYTKALFALIMELSRASQNRLIDTECEETRRISRAIRETPTEFPVSATVACRGMDGADSRLACKKLFDRPSISFFGDYEAVFSAVKEGICRYGVVPVRSSAAGSLNTVYDLLMKYDLSIVRSVCLSVDHKPMALPGVQTDGIRQVNSYLCFSRDLEIYPGADRTSLILSLVNRPGSLYRIVSLFYALGININRLDSRVPQNGDLPYVFYFDLDTPVLTPVLRQLMSEIGSVCEEYRYLGSYREVLS